MPLIFVIAFTNTDFALIILIFSMLLSPEFSLGGVTGRAVVLRFDDIFLFIVFLGWLTKMAVNKEIGLLKVTAINLPIIAYIFICIVSTSIGILQGTTKLKESFFYILKYIEYFIIFFMVSNNLNDKRQIKLFLFFMLITCFIVSLYGTWSVMAEGMRATAPFEGEKGEANTLAGYLLLMMSAALGILLYSSSIKLRFTLMFFLAFALWPFFHTYSRGGLLGFAIAYIFFVLLSKRYKAILLLGLIIIVMIFPSLITQAVFYRLRYTFNMGDRVRIFGRNIRLDESTADRIRSLQDALRRLKDRPLLGHGVAAHRVLSDVQYARILREVGVIGILVFFWMIIRLFRVGWIAFRDKNSDDFERGLSLGYICALAGFLAMSFGAEVFIIIRIMEPFWFLTAIIVTLPEINKNIPRAAFSNSS